MINDKQLKKNAQSFTKRLSKNESELRIFIEYDKV